VADEIALDHVAVATGTPDVAVSTLIGDLGGTLIEGGDAFGFRWLQVRLGDGAEGMTVEVITPWRPEVNDFLARFVERHSEGQHHLTFKVPDLRRTVARCRAAGYHPIGENYDDPQWFEAFLVPREAQGTVVQITQSEPPPLPWPERFAQRIARGAPDGRPTWWADPPPAGPTRAVLRRIVLRTPSITSALGLWCGLLGGTPVDQGDDRIEIAWPGGRILLLEDTGSPPGFECLEADAPAPIESVRVAGAAVHVTAR
jgi:catechol 2,3-dioxygenase-like lactoylglutathione lyase family enzyme